MRFLYLMMWCRAVVRLAVWPVCHPCRVSIVRWVFSCVRERAREVAVFLRPLGMLIYCLRAVVGLAVWPRVPLMSRYPLWSESYLLLRVSVFARLRWESALPLC